MKEFKTRVLRATSQEGGQTWIQVQHLEGSEQGFEIPSGTMTILAIEGLLGEKEILRALLKLLFKNEIRIINPNEFNRKVNDLAKKIDADPECVRIILEELTRELTEEMFAPIAPDNVRRSVGDRGRTPGPADPTTTTD